MPSIDIQDIRLLIQDTEPHETGTEGEEPEYWLTDEQIQRAINLEHDVWTAAALCLEILATDVAKIAKSQSGGQFGSSKNEIHSSLLESAEKYRERSHSEPFSETVEERVYPWLPLDRVYGSTEPLDEMI